MDGRVGHRGRIAKRAMWASVATPFRSHQSNLSEIGFTLLAGLVDGSPPLHARRLLLVISSRTSLPRWPPPSSLLLRKRSKLARETPDAALGAPLHRQIATRAV